jgi:hypothetical protein
MPSIGAAGEYALVVVVVVVSKERQEQDEGNDRALHIRMPLIPDPDCNYFGIAPIPGFVHRILACLSLSTIHTREDWARLPWSSLFF